MAKKKNPYEEIENKIISELNQHTPGSPEYKAILENLTSFKRSLEETRNNTEKESLEKQKIELEKKKIEQEMKEREKDRENLNEQKQLDRQAEERRAELDRQAEAFKAKHNFFGSLGAAIITSAASIAVVGIANGAAKNRTREVLYYEETGTISSNGGKNIINNSLKPIKG